MRIGGSFPRCRPALQLKIGKLPILEVKNRMKRLKILLLSCLLALGLALAAVPVMADEGGHDGAANLLEQQVDGYWIRLTFVDGPGKVGNNTINVQVLDPQGQPVTNAGISIVTELYSNAPQTSEHAGMNMTGADHDMGSMGKPLQTTKINLTAIPYSTNFEGNLELSKAGYWMVNVIVGLQPQMKSAMFPLNLVKTGPNWYVLGVFFGLIAAIIIIGGLTKRKATKLPLPEVAA